MPEYAFNHRLKTQSSDNGPHLNLPFIRGPKNPMAVSIVKGDELWQLFPGLVMSAACSEDPTPTYSPTPLQHRRMQLLPIGNNFSLEPLNQ
ncbi:unnamed protein product [Protopolystoma xenopodis]|uniref:Uncharacterized protein n=1 Tax=Protopolystoma xenopodis TaxID=117903 RepID=A0A448XK42_9PLAT|nr:unnamed protein product [Protopolystoma xenopodis]